LDVKKKMRIIRKKNYFAAAVRFSLTNRNKHGIIAELATPGLLYSYTLFGYGPLGGKGEERSDEPWGKTVRG